MRKHFVINIIFLVLANLIVKPLWIFGIDRNVQNITGHQSYGLYQAVFNVTVIFQILLDFGLQSYNNNVVTRAPQAMRNLFPNILAAKGIFALVYIIAVLLMGTVLGFATQSFILLLALVFVQIFISFLLFFRSNIAALQYFKTDSFFSVFDRILVIIICSVLLFSPMFRAQFRIEWFAIVQAFTFGISALIAFWVCMKLSKINWHHINLKKIKIIAKQSLPFALLIFVMSIYMRVDVVLLETLLPHSEMSGRYAASYRLLDISNNMTGVLFAGLLLPMFSKLIAHKNDVRPLIKMSLSMLMPVAIIAVIICLFFGTAILQLLYKDMRAEDGEMLFFMMLCFPFYSINYVYSTLLTAKGCIKPQIFLAIFAAVINIVLNAVLIPLMESRAGVGVAMVAAFTMFITSVGNVYLSKKEFRLRLDYRWLIKFIGFGLLILCTSFLLANKFTLSLFQNIAVVSLSGVFAFFVLGIFSIKEIKQNLQKILKK